MLKPAEQPGPSKKQSPDAAMASTLGRRLARAQQSLDDKLDDGQEYLRYVIGAPPRKRDDDEDSDDAPSISSLGPGWNQVTFPAHGMLCAILTPSLVAKAPTYINRARKSAPEIERARGKIYQELARVIERESDVHGQMVAAVEDCYINSASYLIVDYDPERRIPVVRHVPCERVLVDQETDGRGFMRDIRWLAEKRSISHADATWLAKNVWKVNYEFHPSRNTWDETDEAEAENDPNLDDKDETLPTKFVRLAFVYVKGNNPYTKKADLADPANRENTSKDDVYRGKDELIILEYRGGSRPDGNKYKFVARQPWPFPCDPDEFPMTALRLTRPRRGFYPHSLLQPSHSLQCAVDLALTFHNTDLFNSCRRWISYDKSVFKSDKEVEAVFDDGRNLPIVGHDRAVGPDAVKINDFGKPNPSLMEGVVADLTQYRDVSGITAFDAEARNKSHQTATGAAISNEGAQLRIGALADMVEEAYRSVMRKALQCARRWMTAEDVAMWIGEDLMEFRPAQDETGAPVSVTPLWDDRVTDVAAIRREVDIDIEPRSVRFVSPEREVQDIQMLMTQQVNAAGVVQKAVAENAIPFARGIAKAMNAAILAQAERLHLANADDYLFDLNSIVPPPTPPAEQQFPPNLNGPSMMQRETRRPDGTVSREISRTDGQQPGPNPQLLGEAMQMVRSGVDPNSLPPQMQMALMDMARKQGGMS